MMDTIEDDDILVASEWEEGTHAASVNNKIVKLSSYVVRMVFVDLMLTGILLFLVKMMSSPGSTDQFITLSNLLVTTVAIIVFIFVNIEFFNRIMNVPAVKGSVYVGDSKIAKMMKNIGTTELVWRPRIVYNGEKGLPTRISLTGLDDGRSVIKCMTFMPGLADGLYTIHGRFHNIDDEEFKAGDFDFIPKSVMRRVQVQAKGSKIRLVVLKSEQDMFIPESIRANDPPYGDAKTYYDEGCLYLNTPKPRKDIVLAKSLAKAIPQLASSTVKSDLEKNEDHDD